jgi:hypothetical protein
VRQAGKTVGGGRLELVNMRSTMRRSFLLAALAALAAAQPPAAAAPSPKKGVGVWAYDGAGKALADVRVSWFYTWQPTTAGVPVPSGVAFVPMVWNATHVTSANLSKAKQVSDVLLGFNEPDHPEQSNMTVEQVLDLWPQLEATGMRLGSPATANDPREPGSWLERFLAGARQRGLRVDFLALHHYVGTFDAKGGTAELQAFLQGVHDKFDLPVWLTEYALVRWTVPATYGTREQQAAFAAASVDMLEKLPFVERYAWFALPPAASAPSLDPKETVSLYDAVGAATLVGAAYRAAGLVMAGAPGLDAGSGGMAGAAMGDRGGSGAAGAPAGAVAGNVGTAGHAGSPAAGGRGGASGPGGSGSSGHGSAGDAGSSQARPASSCAFATTGRERGTSPVVALVLIGAWARRRARQGSRATGSST